MTDEELAAIKARADAATKGEWFVTEDDSVIIDRGAYGKEGIKSLWIEWDGRGTGYAPALGIDYYTPKQRLCDANLIAHARQDILALLAEVEAWREIGRAVARGFTLVYAEHRNAEVCALCDAQVACDDFGMDSRRDAVGWYEQHIQHAADCPVMKARALLGQADHGATSSD